MPLKLVPRPPLPPHSYDLTPAQLVEERVQERAESSKRVKGRDQDASDAGPSVQRHPRPPSDFLAEKDMHMFGANPLAGRDESGRGLVRCEKCARVTMEWNWAEHQRVCRHVLEGIPLTKKGAAGKTMKSKTDGSQKRRASEDSDDGSPLKKRITEPSDRSINIPSGDLGALDDVPKSNKLKKGELKRMKKERERLERKEIKEKEKAAAAERKRMRANGPIDLDKQCGVLNDKNTLCARSLTCKSHTVGAKRAVPGRSRPFDELHLEWQRLHNPNFKESTRKEGSSSSKTGLGVSGLKATKNGIRRDSKKGDDEEGRVMGEGEVGELIHLAKMAGERCQLVIGLIGTAGNHGSGVGSNGAAGSKRAVAFGSKAIDGGNQDKDRFRYSLPRPTICDAYWPGHKQFVGIGEQLVSALAVRPKVMARFNRPSNLNAAGAPVGTKGNANAGSTGVGTNVKINLNINGSHLNAGNGLPAQSQRGTQGMDANMTVPGLSVPGMPLHNGGLQGMPFVFPSVVGSMIAPTAAAAS